MGWEESSEGWAGLTLLALVLAPELLQLLLFLLLLLAPPRLHVELKESGRRVSGGPVAAALR